MHRHPIAQARDRDRDSRPARGPESLASQSRERERPSRVRAPSVDGRSSYRPGDALLEGRFEVLRVLGEGTFANVLLCRDRAERSEVAVKVVRAIDRYQDAAEHEIQVCHKMRDRFLGARGQEERCVYFRHSFYEGGHPCLVFDALGPTLLDVLDKHNRALPEHFVRCVGEQVLKGLDFLHFSMRLIHTDLKPENIMFARHGPLEQGYPLLRIIDFGSATFEHGHHSRVVCTRHYRPPEVIAERPWSFPIDLWSLACVLVELVLVDPLFIAHDDAHHFRLMEEILGPAPPGYGSAVRSSKKRSRPPTIQYLLRNYPVLLDLVRRLLRFEPDARLRPNEALRHMFFDGPKGRGAWV